MTRISHFIDGMPSAPASGGYVEVFEPATGRPYAECPDGDERDVSAAVAAAKRAFPGWASTPADERSRLLLAIAERIAARRDALARAESVDTGKPVGVAASVDI